MLVPLQLSPVVVDQIDGVVADVPEDALSVGHEWNTVPCISGKTRKR